MVLMAGRGGESASGTLRRYPGRGWFSTDRLSVLRARPRFEYGPTFVAGGRERRHNEMRNGRTDR